MILRQLLTAVVSLALFLIIFGVAFAQDQQKKPERQQPQKVSSPARSAPTPAPCLQPPRAPAQTVRPPVTQSPRPSPSQIRSQNPRQQPPRPPAQVHPGYYPQRPKSGQTVNPATPTMRPRPVQPPARVVRPPASPSVPQGGINAVRSPQAPKNLTPQAGPTGKQPSVKSPVAATPQPPSSQASPVAKPGTGQPISSAGTHHQDPQPATSPPKTPEAKGKVAASGEQNPAKTEEVKYKRDPNLANVKWSDNELRDHIKGNLDTLGEKYDKNKYGDMARKDLEQAYSKIHSQAEKQEVKDKIKDKLKDLGEKYDSRKYDKLSQNELEKKYDSLKDKAASKKINSNAPESWSKDQLKDHIKQLSDSLGEKYKKNYDKQSQRELVNSYKALEGEKAQKDAAAKKQGSEHPTSQLHAGTQNQQPGQTGATASSGSSPAQTGSQQDLISRRDQLKSELLKKDGENVKEANKLRDEIDKLNGQIMNNEKAQAANTGLGVIMSGKGGPAGMALNGINQIGIQGGSLLSDRFLSGGLKDKVDNGILGWRSATDLFSASHGDPSGSFDAVLMSERKALEMRRDEDMNRLNSLGQDPETRKLRDDYHKAMQQIGSK